MPRDDLSIDFVKRMTQAEPLDPALILDDWIYRVQNLPEEIRFLQDEIADKDRQYAECTRVVDDRDAKIQKWIKSNGSHEPNPQEESHRSKVRENFAKAELLANEKVALAQRLQMILDKHLRALDGQIKLLYDRAEPGFTEPDEVPSLLRASAANYSSNAMRTITTTPNATSTGSATAAPATAAATTTPAPAPAPLKPVLHIATPVPVRAPNPQVRNNQSQQHPASAPATPAASMILNRTVRETSAGPGSGAPKRGPRVNSGLSNAPTTSSGLARHSSLGPGTPKLAAPTGPGGVVRAGSAGPRTSTTKPSTVAGVGRKAGTPGAIGRKKAGALNGKSSLSRVKKASNKNSPASTADSELSDAESGTGDDDDEDKPSVGRGGGSATPAADTKDRDGDEAMADADDDEGSDDKKYCLCQNVSFGDMVACDNDDCPFEWFHWSCVGLKSEPNGKWYCPMCSEKDKAKKPK